MGRLSALKQVEKSKGATQTIKESIIQWIKTIDPLEVTAIGGLTLIVHNFMINTPKILEGISNTLNLLAIPVPILPLLELTGLVPKNLGADQWKEILKNNEVIVWLVAFSLAYVMVRHAGALIGLVNGGIDKIVPFLLGIT